MKTILLDRDTWDLCVDADGNIAVASEPYAVMQDVSSSCRLFFGELWFDASQGLPYFERVLGKDPPKSLIEALFVERALLVPTVISAVCIIDGVTISRKVSGSVKFTVTTGQTLNVGF